MPCLRAALRYTIKQAGTGIVQFNAVHNHNYADDMYANKKSEMFPPRLMHDDTVITARPRPSSRGID